MRQILIRSQVLAMALTLLPVVPLTAAELAGVTFDDGAEVAGTHLALNGLGVRKKLIVKVYVGGLYLESRSGDAGLFVYDGDAFENARG